MVVLQVVLNLNPQTLVAFQIERIVLIPISHESESGQLLGLIVAACDIIAWRNLQNFVDNSVEINKYICLSKGAVKDIKGFGVENLPYGLLSGSPMRL